ncbi:MAG: glycosyltransferase [Actinomycetota bacterium]
MRFAFVSTWPPRKCGIATFSADLIQAVREADPKLRCEVAAIDEPHVARAYGATVRWRISQGQPDSYARIGHAIATSTVDAVCVQHEFGLYGRWPEETWEDGRWIAGGYEDHLLPFLENVEKPTLVTMHTVLPEPSPGIRDAVRAVAAASTGLIVQAETAVGILRDTYGVTAPIHVIQHGMPHIEPRGRRRLKEKMGLQGRQIISTFGLVGPGKGLEYVIEAMPRVAAAHPDALYLVAGQTHPELLRQHGEEYRNGLMKSVDALDLGDHVKFINQYMSQEDLIDLLLASDVYVTPYLDPNQITSGTLSYALGAGKAVVSTPYLHAQEALADERGVLVPFRSAEGIAEAIHGILADPARKATLERNAYAYANEFTWPKTGKRVHELMRSIVREEPKRKRVRRRPGGSVARPIAARLPENPLISPADVRPSQAGLEVVSTINAGIAQVGDEVVALVRVAERPALDAGIPPGARLLDLRGQSPELAPLPEGLRSEDVVGVPIIDMESPRHDLVIAVVRRDDPNVDLSDPRTVRFRNPNLPHDAQTTDFLSHISHLRVARSADGARFTIEAEPSIRPMGPLEEYGVEDARVTDLEDEFAITYVAVSRLGITTALLRTTDFRTFERHGTIFLPDMKDVVLFPGKVNGRYVAFTRPMPASFQHVLGIWLAESPDLAHWGGHRPVALPRPGMWDETRIGASLVPIRVDGGWLELYHGADRTNRYGMGALLLDAEDPSRALARTLDPLLVPELPYERDGLLHDVVFPSGHVVLDDGRIRVYYGGADTHLAAADFTLDDVLAQLRPC